MTEFEEWMAGLISGIARRMAGIVELQYLLGDALVASCKKNVYDETEHGCFTAATTMIRMDN